jgi:hypothetical protein
MKNSAKSKLAGSAGCYPPWSSFLVIARDLRENQRSMALRLPKQDYQDIERVIELDFVRATEAAALNSLRWLGRGDKEAADAAASDAIRGMFDLMNICGEVVIGEESRITPRGFSKANNSARGIPVRRNFTLLSIQSMARPTFPRARRTRSLASRQRAPRKG